MQAFLAVKYHDDSTLLAKELPVGSTVLIGSFEAANQLPYLSYVHRFLCSINITFGDSMHAYRMLSSL